jgi:predicted lipoprotein with Yx(FWY)xxD motif
MSWNRLCTQHSPVDEAVGPSTPCGARRDGHRHRVDRLDRRENIMMAGRIFAFGMGFALLAAACGGATTTSEPAASSAQPTVSVQQVPGVGSIYTNANGMALYTPDQEANGEVECTGPCTRI